MSEPKTVPLLLRCTRCGTTLYAPDHTIIPGKITCPACEVIAGLRMTLESANMHVDAKTGAING